MFFFFFWFFGYIFVGLSILFYGQALLLPQLQKHAANVTKGDQCSCNETVSFIFFFNFFLLFDDFASAAPNALQLSLVFLLCTLYFLLFCANNCGLLPNQSHLFVLLVLLAHVVFVALLSLLLALVFIGL